MRLVCPKCAAQYEVDDSVIPEGGRDVQCSACGHGWFQASADPAAEQSPEPAPPPQAEIAAPSERDAATLVTEPEAAVYEAPPEPAPEPLAPEDIQPSEVEAEPEPLPTEAAEPAPAPEPEPEPEKKSNEAIDSVIADMMRDTALSGVDTDYAEDSDYDDGLAPAPAVGTTPRKPVDDGMMSILREEAEREAEQRRAEGSPIETQPELGLSAPVPVAPRVTPREHLDEDTIEDRFVDFPDDEETEFDESGVLRSRGSERLPDIEEINSTLTADADRSEPLGPEIAEEAARQRSGFGFGFALVLVLAVAGAALYVFAAQIVAAVPSLEVPITQFVALVDAGRVWLDQQIQLVIERLLSGDSA